MKKYEQLYKRVIALLLAFLFAYSGVVPTTKDASAAEGVREDALFFSDAFEEAEEEEALFSDDPVPGIPADVTIMYYMLGADLERDSLEATKDMIEIMSGLMQADMAVASPFNAADVNVIVETGGVKFDDKSRAQYESLKEEFKEETGKGDNGHREDSHLFDLLTGVNGGKGIEWDKNERWKLSGDRIEEISENETTKVTNETRVMTGIKTEQDSYSPELVEFISTTARAYPASHYMLVLWDHGGGPKGGFGGDERDGGENAYLTADQLARSLKMAKEQIRSNEKNAVNAGFEKFAFVGFDACLMGNLEIGIALAPYARYMFASEDLEPGSGWDHRGYVSEIVYPVSSPAGPEMAYTDDMLGPTVQAFGSRLVDDNTKYSDDNGIRSTMSVINLDLYDLGALNIELNKLSEALLSSMTGGNDKFSRDAYVKFLEAARECINFNVSGEGIVDLYSLCGKLAEKFDDKDIRESAEAVRTLLKMKGGAGEAQDDGLVIEQKYSRYYYFSSGDNKYDRLGGLTVFLPYKNNRITYTDDDGNDTVYDGLTEYLEIYRKVAEGFKNEYDENYLGVIKADYGISSGYLSLIKAFCAAQGIGAVLGNTYDRSVEEISVEMNKAKTDLEKDYGLLNDRIAKMLDDMAAVDSDIIRGRITSDDCHMKSVISGNGLAYVLDESVEKSELIKSIRQHMTLTDKDGKKYRLGYIPGALSPVKQEGSTVCRYEITNLKEQKWFFINDTAPAAVLSVRNLDSETEQDYFDALGKTHLIVQFPAAMQKKNAEYYEDVVLEAEFTSGDLKDVAPRGYYGVDTNTRQLAGYTSWSEVAEDTSFWLVSDLGEFFENSGNDYDEKDSRNCIYTTSFSKAEVLFSRDRSLSYGLEKLEYITSGVIDYEIDDIFDGAYGIDDLRDGELIYAQIVLTDGTNDRIGTIRQGTGGVSPKYKLILDSGEYELEFAEEDALTIGYYDTEGGFYPLTSDADIEALEPGTYPLTFREYDYDKACFVFDENTQLKIGGLETTVSAFDYAFCLPDENTVLTVDPSDSVTVRFMSLRDDKELAPEMTVYKSVVTDDGRYAVAGNAICIKGDPVKQWYIGIGDDRRVPVYMDGRSLPYYEYDGNTDVGKVLAVPGEGNGNWFFYLPGAALSDEVAFYADYEEKTSDTKIVKGDDLGLIIDQVLPVEYTGKALVTTTADKSGSKLIELVIRNKDGYVLQEGTDYSVSYKNNKNAGTPDANKPPTLIINGKRDYKGFKAEERFTILPADLSNAKVESNMFYVPLKSSGRTDLKLTVIPPGGEKVPANRFEVSLFDDEKVYGKDDLKAMYNGTETKTLEVVATAIKPDKGVSNYRIGSMTKPVKVIVYPKKKYTLNVKLKKSSQEYHSGVVYKVSDIAAEQLKTVSLSGSSKEKLGPSDLLPVKAYYDKNLLHPTAEDGSLIDRSGVVYLAFLMNDPTNVYKPAIVKYNFKGTKLSKGKTAVDSGNSNKNNFTFEGSGISVPITVHIDQKKTTAKEMTVTCTTRDGRTYNATVGYAANEINGVSYDHKIDDNGYVTLSGIDNGAIGTYSITFNGLDDHTGNFKLSYKIKK